MSLDAGTPADAPVRKAKASGPGKHRAIGQRPPAPHYRIAAATPANVAVETLAPWNVADYPGRLKIARSVLHNRAKPHSIRDWRRGTRRTPAWALDLLTVALEQRRAEIDHALALLAKEKGRS